MTQMFNQLSGLFFNIIQVSINLIIMLNREHSSLFRTMMKALKRQDGVGTPSARTEPKSIHQAGGAENMSTTFFHDGRVEISSHHLATFFLDANISSFPAAQM